MADSVESYYRSKLVDLRVIELKQILNDVGSSRTGRKQDLVDRILVHLREDCDLGKDDVAKIIDQTYNTYGSTKSDKPQKITQNPENLRCICEIPSKDAGKTIGVIMCDDQTCGTWQHASCVNRPIPIEGTCPKPFYCELCRLSRFDPFSVTMPEIPLPALKIPASLDQMIISKGFTLSPASKEFDVQAWCMVLNDDVLFRVQWPRNIDLKVNGAQVRPTSRSVSISLGANGRDDGVIITQLTNIGKNNICLRAKDDRPFCLGVRLVKRRSLEQVMELIPQESQGERLEEAVARVSRCLGGGGSGGDLEVVSGFVSVNLRCPMSGSRMKVAGRFKQCVHMGCFDLEVFVEMNMRSKKWQCPVCLKNYCLDDLIIDPYFNRVVSRLQRLGQDVSEIEVKPDASWRVKSSGNLGWHSPDGSPMEVESGESELGDAGVVVLISDSEDDKTEKDDGTVDIVGTPGSIMVSGASEKRGREASGTSPFSSFPTKRRSRSIIKDDVVHHID